MLDNNHDTHLASSLDNTLFDEVSMARIKLLESPHFISMLNVEPTRTRSDRHAESIRLLISLSSRTLPNFLISKHSDLQFKQRLLLTDRPISAFPYPSVIATRLHRWPRYPVNMPSSIRDTDVFLAHKSPTDARRKKRPGACTRCRNRKVKCDGRLPVCGSCVKARTECDVNTASAQR